MGKCNCTARIDPQGLHAPWCDEWKGPQAQVRDTLKQHQIELLTQRVTDIYSGVMGYAISPDTKPKRRHISSIRYVIIGMFHVDTKLDEIEKKTPRQLAEWLYEQGAM